MLFALWAFGGWCGTPYPGWLFGPRPHPDPEPWWVVKIVSIIGGHQDAGGMMVVATVVGAFVTGGFLGGAVRLVMGGRGPAT